MHQRKYTLFTYLNCTKTVKKSRREITGDDEAHILLFAADEATAHIVAGIAKVDVYIISHAPRRLEGMLNEALAV